MVRKDLGTYFVNRMLNVGQIYIIYYYSALDTRKKHVLAANKDEYPRRVRASIPGVWKRHVYQKINLEENIMSQTAAMLVGVQGRARRIQT